MTQKYQKQGMTQKYQKQDLNSFAKGVIQRTKNGPRAVFKTEEGYRDVPQDGQVYPKLLKHGYQLVGIYDNQCKVNWLQSDLQ